MLENILCLYLCACMRVSVTLSIGPADLGCHGDRCQWTPYSSAIEVSIVGWRAHALPRDEKIMKARAKVGSHVDNLDLYLRFKVRMVCLGQRMPEQEMFEKC